MPFYRRFVNNETTLCRRARSATLLKRTSVVGLMTLLSRVLGFIRDIVFASIFGAGGAFDAFLVAFKIPNFFRRLFGEGAFSQAFVPVLSETMVTDERQVLQQFVARVFTRLALGCVIFVLLGELCAPLIIALFAPGFLQDPARFEMAQHLLRITLPYVLLIAMVAMSAAVLNAHQRFAIPAFAPVLLNVAFVVAAYYWVPHAAAPLTVLAWAVLVGGVMQLLIQLPTLARLQLLPRFSWARDDQRVKQVLRLMVPALFGVSVAQISLLIDNMFASFLPHGSISWLYYSDRLTYLPLGVIGVALATVVLPTLSKAHHQDAEAYSNTLSFALRVTFFLGLPAAGALMVLSCPILLTLFYHGQFGLQDVLMSQLSLMAFALGLPAFMLIKVLAAAFYARQDIGSPVRVAAVALGLNVVGNFILIHFLAHAGLALATSLAAYANVAGLMWLLIRRRIYVMPVTAWRSALRLLLANGAMVGSLLMTKPSWQAWLHWPVMVRVSHLVMLVALGMSVYFAVLWLCGWRSRELRV